MNQALLQNTLIIAAIITCLVVLQNPLALIGLMLLAPLPHGVATAEQQLDALRLQGGDMDDEDEETPMGFTANVR